MPVRSLVSNVSRAEILEYDFCHTHHTAVWYVSHERVMCVVGHSFDER